MVDPQQFAVLKLGVNAWNRWRQETQTAVPDLGGADLRRVHLTDINLAGSDLHLADLRETTLFRADIRSQSPPGEHSWDKPQSARSSRADLRSAAFCKADLRYASLLSDADLRDANLIHTEVQTFAIPTSALRKLPHVGRRPSLSGRGPQCIRRPLRHQILRWTTKWASFTNWIGGK